MADKKNEWNEASGGDFFKFEKAGDKIQGVLVERKPEQGDFKSTVYTVKSEGKNVSFFSNALLDDKLKDRELNKTEVLVEFLGLKKSKKGREFKDFSVKYRTFEPTFEEDVPADF